MSFLRRTRRTSPDPRDPEHREPEAEQPSKLPREKRPSGATPSSSRKLSPSAKKSRPTNQKHLLPAPPLQHAEKPQMPFNGMVERKFSNMERYRIMRIIELHSCTEQEALQIIKEQDAFRPKKRKFSFRKHSKALNKRTTYKFGDKYVVGIVSGGAGPGTGKRK